MEAANAVVQVYFSSIVGSVPSRVRSRAKSLDTIGGIDPFPLPSEIGSKRLHRKSHAALR
jgi:hypothetical protein